VAIDAWLTLAVLAVLVLVLVREMAPPAVSILGALVTLVLLDVVTPAQAFVGFSSTATITIAGLFVVAGALNEHAHIEALLGRVLGDGSDERASLARLVAPSAGLSAVMANTPLVAAFAPAVRTWAERNSRPASLYLIPLSFAAILGALTTLIGTSTTLVVSGLVEESMGEALGFFEITPLGLPIAVVGSVLLVLLAPHLLPDRRPVELAVAAGERDYRVQMVVEPGGPLEGATVREAGLRNLEGLFLARVHRHGREIVPVHPEEPLEGGDVLVFVGRVEDVTGMESQAGLAHAEGLQLSLLEGDRHRSFEAVVGRDSHLVGRTLQGVSFRGRYGGVVLAIHRDGERVSGKLGALALRPGDVLLVQADRDFAERARGASAFAVVAPLGEDTTPVSQRRWLVVGVGAAMVGVAAIGLVDIAVAVLGACLALLLTRTIGFHEAKEALDIDVLLIVASAIGLGAAVERSGLAAVAADGIAEIGAIGGEVGALLAIIVGTLILTELVTNVAAAAIMVPIALSIAGEVGADPRTFALVVAVSGSASFLTPIGYQTNTIVYGLGGYHFGDYWRLGAPLTAVVIAVTVVMVSVVW